MAELFFLAKLPRQARLASTRPAHARAAAPPAKGVAKEESSSSIVEAWPKISSFRAWRS